MKLKKDSHPFFHHKFNLHLLSISVCLQRPKSPNLPLHLLPLLPPSSSSRTTTVAAQPPLKPTTSSPPTTTDRLPLFEDVLGEVLRIRRLGTSQRFKTISKEQFQLIYKVAQLYFQVAKLRGRVAAGMTRSFIGLIKKTLFASACVSKTNGYYNSDY
ncbi:hypothetical protein ACS0TY_017780 [Phlomoides rotata]